jgi:UDP-2-acetamido-3-amino-2,3-dideoxy-glucuronate N-acetyltransferase
MILRCKSKVENNNYFVHASSYIDEPCIIGEGTKIWHFCHVMKDCVIGRDCNLGQNVYISSEVIIGDRVKIQNNLSVYTGVICEDDVFLGPSCVFTNVINPRSFIERKKEYRRTLIGKGASIGANSTIVCGNNIGKYALVGAGAVITKDVPDYGVVVGNPEKLIGYVCKCGQRINFVDKEHETCSSCGKLYLMINGIVRCVEQ